MLRNLSRRRQMGLGLAVVVIIAIIVYMLSKQHAAPLKANANTIVHAETIKLGAYAPELSLYGEVESDQRTKLEAGITAYVKATPILVGQRFARGTVIVELDDKDAQINLTKANADIKIIDSQIKNTGGQVKIAKLIFTIEKEKFDLAKKAYDRQQNLAQKEFGSKAQLENTENDLKKASINATNAKSDFENKKHRLLELTAELDKAEAIRDDAELDMMRTMIRAPFAGRLIKRMVAIGDRVSPSERVAEIFDDDDMVIKAQIPNQYINMINSSLHDGRELKARGYFQQLRFNARLQRLNFFVAKGHAGMDAYFKVQDNTALPLGSNVNFLLTLPQQANVISIPNTALYRSSFVYRIVSERLLAVKVKVIGEYHTIDGDTRLLVSSDELANGDKLLSSYLPNAVTGLPVSVQA